MGEHKVIQYMELKTLVNKNGFNWSLIGEVVGRTPSSVSQVARGVNKNPRIARAIQTAADIPFEQIFGMTLEEYEEAAGPARMTIPADEAAARKAKLVQALNA